MPRLTKALTRDEVVQQLQVDPSIVEALVESGAVLCHVRGGEARIPLAELENFFRDALVGLYRAEAMTAVAAIPEAKAEEPREAVAVPQPAVPVAPVVPMPAAARELPEEEPEKSLDLRITTRYVPLRHIDGIFNDQKFTIVQMSKTGLRIRHKGELMPGDEVKISFALMSPAQSFVMRVRVVWTSLARAGDDTFSISGLRVIEHVDRLVRAVDILSASHDLQPERRVSERRKREELVLEGVSDDEAALVMAAVQKFAADPVEANRWYSRARFALSDENVRREAPPRPRDREEVLGIWEYLDRKVEIAKVLGVLSWMRKARAV